MDEELFLFYFCHFNVVFGDFGCVFLLRNVKKWDRNTAFDTPLEVCNSQEEKNYLQLDILVLQLDCSNAGVKNY